MWSDFGWCMKGATDSSTEHIVNTDPEMPPKYNLIGSFDGSYIDNTSIFSVMKRALMK
jgi:hypothetical protein